MSKADDKMEENKVRQLVVVEENGTVVGIIWDYQVAAGCFE
jgi:CBS domain-containing protein